jgi:uncharacterized membrane protein
MMGFGLLWIVFLVVGLFFLAREGSGLQALFGTKQSGWQEKTEASAKDILNQRYASGEITPDQYQAMKQDLNLQ